MSLTGNIRAAQYVRMSTGHQQYAIDNQKRAIATYADLHGFQIVRTYVDAGRSGVRAENRLGLQQLMRDVLGGSADYSAILVYDVSRWGRFQDSDEAAHYEFLCKNAGVVVRYCAELFGGSGMWLDQLLKVLKRTMAAEYSRELGVKTYAGQKRLAQLGFRVGGPCGYALRRLMVSKERKPKKLLAKGEIKNLSTDRVILVPGPKKEVACIRDIYKMVLKGQTNLTAIANHLNGQGRMRGNQPWTAATINRVLTSAKYAGKNIWGRTSSRLDAPTRPTPASEWTTRDNAFDAIVDPAAFERVQATLREGRERPTDHELSIDLQNLLTKEGKLTQSIINRANLRHKTRCTQRRALHYFYDRIGYNYKPHIFVSSEQHIVHNKLRAKLFAHLLELFPNRLSTFNLPDRLRRLIRCDTGAIVSVVLCPCRVTQRGIPQWKLVLHPAECPFATLLCRLNGSNDAFLDYFLFQHMTVRKERWFADDDPWFLTGAPLTDLSHLYEIVNRYTAQA